MEKVLNYYPSVYQELCRKEAEYYVLKKQNILVNTPEEKKIEDLILDLKDNLCDIITRLLLYEENPYAVFTKLSEKVEEYKKLNCFLKIYAKILEIVVKKELDKIKK